MHAVNGMYQARTNNLTAARQSYERALAPSPGFSEAIGGLTYLDIAANGAAFPVTTLADINVWLGRSMWPDSLIDASIAEFRVNSTLYSADQGGGAGGQVNLVSKTGTNQFHGSLFEFYRNDSLNANTWVNNRAGIVK